MQKSIGYPLPAADAYTDELACLMLFYPDKDEYRQALMSAYFYFGNWLAWEKEADKKGKDAALAWKEAIEVTLGCIEMNTCETILSLLTEIRDNTAIHCCDVVDFTDGDQYTDEVEDGEGDVPQNIIDAGYATGVSDWAGFAEYKCMISHVMVTNMEWQIREFEDITDVSGAVLGGVAAVAAIAAVIIATGGTALVLGIVLGIAGVAGVYAALAEIGEAGLSDLVDDLVAKHDALACAIYNADGSVGAVVALEDAIDDNFSVAEAALLKGLNIAPQLKALYAGRYDAQDIAEKMEDEGYDIGDYDCTCPPAESSYLATFDTDGEYWDITWTDGWVASPANPEGAIKLHWTSGYMEINVAQTQLGAGLSTGDDIEIVKVSLQHWRPSGISPSAVKVIFHPDDTAEEVVKGGTVEDTWTDYDFSPASPIRVDYNEEVVGIRLDGGTGGVGEIDNIRIWFNTL